MYCCLVFISNTHTHPHTRHMWEVKMTAGCAVLSVFSSCSLLRNGTKEHTIHIPYLAGHSLRVDVVDDRAVAIHQSASASSGVAQRSWQQTPPLPPSAKVTRNQWDILRSRSAEAVTANSAKGWMTPRLDHQTPSLLVSLAGRITARDGSRSLP